MLETLGDIPWAALTHAYGPAVDVPDWIRNIARANRESAEASLGHLAAAVFHQGTWDETTAKVVPFLVELIAAPVACADSVAALLADMSAGHNDDGYYGLDPFVFTSDPGPPTDQEAVATLVAIEAGRSVFTEQLAAESAPLRSAVAYLLGGMKPVKETCVALQGALECEVVASVQASLALALGKLGQAPLFETQVPLVEGCMAVAEAWVAGESKTASSSPALINLLTHAFEPSLLWASGHPNRLGVRVLLVHAHRSDEPRGPVIRVLTAALQQRLKRGEGILPNDFSSPTPSPSADHLPAYCSPLTALSTALGVLLFPRRTDLLLPNDLNDEQREALDLVLVHRLSMPTSGIPFRETEDLRRYLAGDGALGSPLQIGVESAPIWCWLHRMTDKELDEQTQARVFDALLSLEPPALLDVALAIQNGTYPHPRTNLCLSPTLFEPLHEELLTHAETLQAMVQTRAEELGTSEFPSATSSSLLVALAQEGSTWPPSDDWIPILKRAIFGKEGLAVFLSLTPSQQLQCVAATGNHYTFAGLIEHVDAAKVAPLFVHNVVQASWPFDDMNTQHILMDLGDAVVAPLRSAEPGLKGKKRELIQRVLNQLVGSPVRIDVVILPREDVLEFVIATDDTVHSYQLNASPKRSDYKPIGQLLMQLGAGDVYFTFEEHPAQAKPIHEHLGYQITQGISGHVNDMTLHLKGYSLHVGLEEGPESALAK